MVQTFLSLNLLNMALPLPFTVLLLCAFAAPIRAYVEELDDSLLETRQPDDIWLIKFYAPWCRLCMEMDATWHLAASELKSAGSPVNVGKCDAVANKGLAKAFKVHSYPAICMWKNDVKYIHSGPRTSDAIVEFAHRVSGPLIRPLTSAQLFQHALQRHDVMFVYVGASSPLKGVYSSVAEKMIVSMYFFSAGRDVLPEGTSLPALPAVVVFKDGGYLSYNETSDGSLMAWVKRERFQNYARIDNYMLYHMGDSEKLVLLAVLDDAHKSPQNLRSKSLVQKFSQDYKDVYSRKVHFGFMVGADYINGLIMGELSLPAVLLLNLSTDSYFLPPERPETERHLLDFMEQVLNGSIQASGGSGVTQRLRRLVYDIKVTLSPLLTEAPVLIFFLMGFPLAILIAACYLCRKNRRGDEDEDQRPVSSWGQNAHQKSD
ncbi:protein disulfide-isomerase tmx3a-like isoform X2 [Stigmatopora nigra]